ncbi:MAG: helix-turn-helix transcriptional regulator [Deltaproteobacteria bacterium]|nr:helix-turn-helix transcriptional regulator [Deltaproteobacteria bacterium]
MKTPTSDSEYRLADDGTLIMTRHQRNFEPRHIFDTFGKVWALAYSDFPPNTIGVQTRDGLCILEGRKAMLTPPGSIVEWVLLRPFELTWQALLFRRPYPEHWSGRAIAFDLGSAEVPSTFTDVEKIMQAKLTLENQVPPPFIDFEKREDSNPYSLRLKRAIDEEFLSEKTLQEYANELGIHPDVMTRYFKQTFGMVPVDYRTQLRLFQSIWTLIIDSPKVSDVAQEMGFNSLKNFYTLFTRYTGLQPGHFRVFGRKQAAKSSKVRAEISL